MLALLLPLLLLSVPAPQEGEPIRAIVLEGQTTVPESTLRSRLQGLVEGARFSWEAAERVRKDWFERFGIIAEYRLERVEGGVRVRWTLTQRTGIRRVEYEGNVALSDEELDEALDLTESGASRRWLTGPGQVLWLIDSLRQRYEEEGYLYAEISAALREADDGMVLQVQLQEGPKVRVDDIDFVGLESFDADDLRDLMDTKESWWFIRNTFRQERLDSDLGKLEEFFVDEGFLDARVALEEMIPSDDYREVDLVLRVSEGPRYTIGSIAFAGNQAFADEELRRLVKMRVGRPLRRVEWQKDLGAIERYYGRRGYIRARVDTTRLVGLRLEEPVVDLTIQLDEDRPKRVRDVIIRGNVNTIDEVIRRDLWLYPGDLINQDEIFYTQDRLRASRLFLRQDGLSDVIVDTQPTDDPEQEDIVIDVVEGDTGFMNFIAGFGSGSGGFFGIAIDKENFDIADLPSGPIAFFPEFFDQRAFHGAGQRLSLRANPGARFSNYVLSFEEPALTGPQKQPLSLDLDLYLRESLLRTYEEDRAGITAVVSKWLTRDASAGLGVRLDRVRITDALSTVPDMVAAQGHHSVRGFLATGFWRSYDSLRNPTQGFRLNARTELLGGVMGGDVEAVKSLLQGQLLIPMMENSEGERHVLEFNAAAAFAEEYGDTDDLPFFERYRAGGLSSLQLRGFDFWGVGPHQGGEPVGGKGALVLNSDYVFPLYSTFDARLHEQIPVLKGVVFVDQGMLESEWEDLDQGLWRISVGVGLKLRIPVQILSAPLEFYYGIPIQRTREDERESFSLSFSTRF